MATKQVNINTRFTELAALTLEAETGNKPRASDIAARLEMWIEQSTIAYTQEFYAGSEKLAPKMDARVLKLINRIFLDMDEPITVDALRIQSRMNIDGVMATLHRLHLLRLIVMGRDDLVRVQLLRKGKRDRVVELEDLENGEYDDQLTELIEIIGE